MQPDRQAVPLRGAIDRPIAAVTERPVAHHQKQHLYETQVGAQRTDLGNGQLNILRRDRESKRAAAARNRANNTRSSCALQSAAAMSALYSATAPCSTLAMARRVPECIERLRAQCVEIGAWHSRRRPPI